ncbi:condensation domain-containing protein, partial [Pyxidicoccus sp. 3LG]
RWRADGTLDFLGRTDFQVKVRGFRIELGEIEAVLRQHPAVSDAVVVAREDRLVAYVVPEAAQTVEPEVLSRFVQERLPSFMVPSTVMLLESFKLNASGKVDRKALPAPTVAVAERSFVAPRTPTEELLSGLFAQVLGVPRVGIHDDFFALGGHSLLATQLTSRLRRAFQVELPLRELFAAPTVASLAERVENAMRAGEGVHAPALVPVPRTGTLPLSFAQQRLWFIDQLEPGSALYNIPSALRLVGALDRTSLERAFTELVRRHEALRTTFTTVQGQPVQVISASSATFPIATVDLTEQPAGSREAEARRLAEAEAQRPFDLTRGPLLRATLVRLAPEDHVLLMTMHHIVSDGWSMGVLVREMTAL